MKDAIVWTQLVLVLKPLDTPDECLGRRIRGGQDGDGGEMNLSAYMQLIQEHTHFYIDAYTTNSPWCSTITPLGFPVEPDVNRQ